MKKRIKILLITSLIINSLFSYCCCAAEKNNEEYLPKDIKPINLQLDRKINTDTNANSNTNTNTNTNKQNDNKNVSFIIDTSKIKKGIYTIQGITEINSSNKITYTESINIKNNYIEISANKLLGTKETKPDKIYDVDIQLLDKDNKVVLYKRIKCQREKVKEDLKNSSYNVVRCLLIILIILFFMFLICLPYTLYY